MTTALQLLTSMASQGVVLTIDAAGLCIDAPAHVLTPEMRAALRRHKSELMALVERCAHTRPPMDASASVNMDALGDHFTVAATAALATASSGDGRAGFTPGEIAILRAAAGARQLPSALLHAVTNVKEIMPGAVITAARRIGTCE